MLHARRVMAFAALAGSVLLLPLAPVALAAGATVAANTRTSADKDTAGARLADSFSASAGSRDHALAVVEGLRSGEGVTLDGLAVSGTGHTMGYGNINIAMSLAQSQMTPGATSRDFLAALDAVMDMRADGKGWGQIAHSLGVNLGQVMGTSRSGQANTKGTSTSKSSGAAKGADEGKSVGRGLGVGAPGGRTGAGSGVANDAGGANAGGNGNGGGAGAGGGGGGGGGKK